MSFAFPEEQIKGQDVFMNPKEVFSSENVDFFMR
jgi:hypothetical protein